MIVVVTHLLSGAFDLFGYSELSLILEVRIFNTLIFLFFRLHKIFGDVFCDLGFQYIFVGMPHDLDDALRGMLPHTLDVVTQVLDPEMAELLKDRLRLLGEGGHEMSASQAGAVSDWPGGVFEAIE